MDIYVWVFTIAEWPRNHDNDLSTIEDESAELDQLAFLYVRRSGRVRERDWGVSTAMLPSRIESKIANTIGEISTRR